MTVLFFVMGYVLHFGEITHKKDIIIIIMIIFSFKNLRVALQVQ